MVTVVFADLVGYTSLSEHLDPERVKRIVDRAFQRLIAVVRPHLDRLADVTGESTYLAIADRSVATYVASAESSRAIRHVGHVVGGGDALQGRDVGKALHGRQAASVGSVMTSWWRHLNGC